MPGIFVHKYGNSHPDPVAWPLGATQIFKAGDPVRASSDLLVVSPVDGTVTTVQELIGFAGQAALGEQSATRTGLSYGGGTGGNATQTMRSFYPATADLLLRTKNFWATGAPGTQQAKLGTNRGGIFKISSQNTTADVAQWGVENTAGVVGTNAADQADIAVQVVDVLDNNMQPVASTATLTAGDGYLVFRVIGVNQWVLSTVAASTAS